MHMKLHRFKMVKKVTAGAMAGDTPVEKNLNAYLTIKFISETYIPDDECLPEARHIISFKKKGLRGEIHRYIEEQFGTAPSPATVKEIIVLLQEK